MCLSVVTLFDCLRITRIHLAKLGDGPDESPTVMVRDKTKTKKLGKNTGILKPSWAFVETKNAELII